MINMKRKIHIQTLNNYPKEVLVLMNEIKMENIENEWRMWIHLMDVIVTEWFKKYLIKIVINRMEMIFVNLIMKRFIKILLLVIKILEMKLEIKQKLYFNILIWVKWSLMLIVKMIINKNLIIYLINVFLN